MTRRERVVESRAACALVIGWAVLLGGCSAPAEPADPALDGGSNEADAGVVPSGRTLVRLDDRVIEIGYDIVDGLAVAEGDILLGDLATLPSPVFSVGVPIGLTWPGAVIPYVVDAGSQPRRATIDAAMTHLARHTPLVFVPRTTETDYVVITRPPDPAYCASYVGRRGGPQGLFFGDLCSQGNLVHELGHAAGLFHEHTRPDRERYVSVDLFNVAPEHRHNFEPVLGRMLTSYDYDSVMHYGSSFFSRFGGPTITKKDGALIGAQRDGLSCADAAGLGVLYGAAPASPTDEIVVRSGDGASLGVLRQGEPGLTTCGVTYQWVNLRGHGFPDGWNARAPDTLFAADLDGDRQQELVVASADAVPGWIGIIGSHGYRLATEWVGHAWVNTEHGSGAEGWNLHVGDRYLVADLDGNDRDEVVVISPDGEWIGILREHLERLVTTWVGVDWVNPIGSSGPAGWNLFAGDRFTVVDLDGDHRDEIFVHSASGVWAGLLRGHDGRLVQSWIAHATIPASAGPGGWGLDQIDQFLPADLDGDGRQELVAVKGEWIGILRGHTGALVASWVGFDWVNTPGGAGPEGWNLVPGDRFYVADLDGDARDELVVSSADGRWLGVLRERGGTLRLTGIALDWINTPGHGGAEGWGLRRGDRFYVADLDGDRRDELFVIAPDGEWRGVLEEQAGALRAVGFDFDWTHQPGGTGATGWNHTAGDRITIADLEP